MSKKSVKVERVSVTVGGKINVGNYQNTERSYTVEASVPAGMTADEALAEVNRLALDALAHDVARLVENQYIERVLESASEDRIRQHVESRESYGYLRMIAPHVAAEVVSDAVALYADRKPVRPENAVVPPAPDYLGDEEYFDDEDDDDFDDEDGEDMDDSDDEADYTGDGFTEEHADGYPADAHPDEVEYEKARKTYPDMPPYADLQTGAPGEPIQINHHQWDDDGASVLDADEDLPIPNEQDKADTIPF